MHRIRRPHLGAATLSIPCCGPWKGIDFSEAMTHSRSHFENLGLCPGRDDGEALLGGRVTGMVHALSNLVPSSSLLPVLNPRSTKLANGFRHVGRLRPSTEREYCSHVKNNS